MQLDHADEHAAGALGVNKDVTPPRIAERLAYKLAAGLLHLLTGIMQVVDLEAHVVQTGAARCQKFVEIAALPERSNDFEPNTTIRVEICGLHVLFVQILLPSGSYAKEPKDAECRLQFGSCP
jgi:hypothetical protein